MAMLWQECRTLVWKLRIGGIGWKCPHVARAMPGCDSSDRRIICGCCQRRGHYCSAKAQTHTKPIAQLQRMTLRTIDVVSFKPVFDLFFRHLVLYPIASLASLVIGPFGHADIAQWSCYLVKRFPLASKWSTKSTNLGPQVVMEMLLIYISCVDLRIYGF